MTIKKNTKKKPKKRKPFPPFSESVWRSRILDTDPLADEEVPVKKRIRYENELDTDPWAEMITKIEHKPVQAKTRPKAPDKSPYLEKLLKKEGIKDFAKDIRLMTRKELLQYFSFKTKGGKINVTLLLKNLIWQTYTWIKQGKLPAIDGNIRSFWYRSVKLIFSRLGFKLTGTRYTEAVYDTFVEMVTKLRLFHYADFGFVDERGHARVTGKNNGNLILFVEKDGLFGLVRKLALKYDATGIALGGFPSYLTTEFFVNDLVNLGIRDNIRLFSMVDYDPSGYWIEREFTQQLKDFGLEVVSVSSLVNPDELSSELVEVCKYKLKQEAKTSNWLKITGGISGEAFGLEADALEYSRLKGTYEKAVEPYLKPVTKEMLGKRCSVCGALISP